MTREEIIRMARDAGFAPYDMSVGFSCNLSDIERFAALVAAAEREACAVLAETPMYRHEIAEKIRARGKNE